ncbi:MAG TPA: VCBS repeat-containing protein [Pyrinomonadaceae bacterium]|nr:VCBS repeat-containing protein [Pyrinomonadaceae bacterium]
MNGTNKKRLLKTLAKLTIVLLVIAVSVIAATLYLMGRRDKEHARFFNTGKAVNVFLGNYTRAIRESFEKKDPAAVMSLYSDRFWSPGRGRWELGSAKDESDVSVSRVVINGKQDMDKQAVRGEVVNYLASIASIDNIWTKIDMIESVDLEKSVVLRVKFILDGKDPHGAVFQDRYFYRWQLVNEAKPPAFDWKIVKDELVQTNGALEGLRVAGDGGSFKEVNLAAAGIDFKHSRDPKLDAEKYSAKMKFDIIEHGSGGASAVDYNNDGRQDIFFPDGVRSRLYRNVSDGSGEVKFIDVTAEAGLEGIDQANAGIFADIDNDGDDDLFVARYLAPNKFYRNDGGKFVDQSKEMGLDFNSTSVTACFLDYDRDGYVDLYIGLYGNAFAEVPRLPFFAQNAQPNRLYHNEHGQGFRDVTASSGIGDTGWALAVASADYDGDGYPDIAVANDFGRKCLFRNNGDGTFTDVAKQAGVLDFSGGMGLTFGDFDDDGLIDLYTSNINSNQRWFGEDMTVSQYMRNVARTRWIVLDMFEYRKFYNLVGSEWMSIGTTIGEGNSLFKNNGDGTFRELKDSHTARAGWGWSVAFFDADNDTDLDIYAANGWITNKNKEDL